MGKIVSYQMLVKVFYRAILSENVHVCNTAHPLGIKEQSDASEIK